MDKAPPIVTWEDAPSIAFDWVAASMIFPSDRAKEALKRAYIQSHNQGQNTALKALRMNWETGTAWPSAEEWLDGDDLEELPDDALLELLFMRLENVAHRLVRNRQVWDILQSDPSVHTVIVNRGQADYREQDYCGFGFDLLLEVKQAIFLLQTPACEHPTCSCTVDPVFPAL